MIINTALATATPIGIEGIFCPSYSDRAPQKEQRQAVNENQNRMVQTYWHRKCVILDSRRRRSGVLAVPCRSRFKSPVFGDRSYFVPFRSKCVVALIRNAHTCFCFSN